MRKTFFVLCLACLTASMACTAWAVDIVLPGTFLYVNTQATFAIPSDPKYSFIKTEWDFTDGGSILEKVGSDVSSQVTFVVQIKNQGKTAIQLNRTGRHQSR